MWCPEERPPAGHGLSTFIAQAWQELIDPSAPDTYQARATNLSILIDDLLHVVNLAEQNEKWRPAIKHVADELADSHRQEKRLLCADDELNILLEYIYKQDGQDPSELKQKIIVAKSLLGNFNQRLTDDLYTLVRNSPHEKFELSRRLNTISSAVQYRNGWSDIDSFPTVDAPKMDPIKLCELITDLLERQKKEFRCTVAVAGNPGTVYAILPTSEFSRARIRRIRKLVALSSWLKEHEGEALIEFTTEAAFASQAAHMAMRRITDILNVHNLNENTADYRAHPSILVESQAGGVDLIEVTPGKHFGLRARANARKLTRLRLKSIGSGLQTHTRLSNALESHRLALSATDPCTAIIHLWTSLETISGRGKSRSIGNHVAETIAPIVAWRRVDKIIGYIAICIHDINKKCGVKIPAELELSNEHSISREDILRGVTGPDKNKTIMALFSMCKDSPLLCNRLMSVWKSLQDPKSMRSSFVNSERRIKWQIHRIYRTRNLLVHQGEQGHLIWRLLQNAQYYTSLTLSRVMHNLSVFSDWEIDAVLKYERLHFDSLLTTLERRPSRLKFGDLIVKRCDNPNRAIWLDG